MNGAIWSCPDGKYGYITADQCAQAQAVPLTLHMKEDNAQWLVCGCEPERQLPYCTFPMMICKVSIYTAMDQRMQSTAEALFADAASAKHPTVLCQAALNVVDASRTVCALIGGREYEVQRGLNRATQVKRQPGSVTKPLLVYAPALEEGSFTAASILKDEPTDFDGYQPKNFGDTYNGLVTLRTAVAKSLNVPAVSVLNSIGLETSVSFANSIGLTCNQEELGLSMALGGLSDGFSPLQISSAYAVLANGGTYHAPKMVTRIENNAGEVLYQSDGQGTQVLGEDTTFILCDILQSVVEEGTGKKLFVENVPLAGKTGTNDYEGKG
ncbi:MAG: transglycosylase domain-containing protein, partial [Christensenellales bacterium]